MASAKKGPEELAARLGGGLPSESSDDEPKDAKELALEDFFAAGKSGDMAAAAAAFQRAYDACAAKYEEPIEEF